MTRGADLLVGALSPLRRLLHPPVHKRMAPGPHPLQPAIYGPIPKPGIMVSCLGCHQESLVWSANIGGRLICPICKCPDLEPEHD